MKAILINKYGGPEVLEYSDTLKPEPGPGEILIRTAYASVNPADWKVRNGRLKLITGKKFPKILGIEGSGTIEKIGKGVTGFKEGQKVFAANNYTTGCYAEYFCVQSKYVIPLPDSMPLENAASIAVTGVTALQCIRDAGRFSDEKEILINGASGGLGIMAVQIAKILGGKLTGVCSTGNVDFVRSLGADHIIDYKNQNILHSGKKFDIILDCAGNLDLSGSRLILERNGILIKVNISRNSLLDVIVSHILGNKRVKLVLMKRNLEDFKWVRDQITSGNIKVFIEKIFKLEDCRKAHELSESLRARGKILLKP